MSDGNAEDREAQDALYRSSTHPRRNEYGANCQAAVNGPRNHAPSNAWPLSQRPSNDRIPDKLVRPPQGRPDLQTRLPSSATRPPRSNGPAGSTPDQRRPGPNSPVTQTFPGSQPPNARRPSAAPYSPARSAPPQRQPIGSSRSNSQPLLVGRGPARDQQYGSRSPRPPPPNVSNPGPGGMRSGPRLRSISHTQHSQRDQRAGPPGAAILRSATSIPDYSTIKGGYRNPARGPNVPNARVLQSQGANNSANTPGRRFLPAGVRDMNGQLNTSLESTRSSGLTNSSSNVEGSGTERSSVKTDRSSVTDDGTASPVHPANVKEDGMSVDDAISMYADGFADDSDLEIPHTDSGRPPPLPLSIKPPNTKMPSSPLTPSESVMVASPTFLEPVSRPFADEDSGIRTSAQIIAGRLDPVDSPPPDSNVFPSATRDRYGFKKATQHVRLERYDAWDAVYSIYLERRRKKWQELMRQYDLPTDNPVSFPPKSDKVKRYIRKGIPPEWRGAAWFWYADGPAYMARHVGLYEGLIARSETEELPEGDREHIERDLYRTFPDNVKFKFDERAAADSSVQQETPMIASLRRVLRAFALKNPHIGYCQSLNFLAGILLVFLDTEEKAFHLLCILTSTYLPGTHGIALEGANVDIGVLMVCIKELMPTVWNKLDDRKDTTASVSAADMRLSTALPTVSLATTAWFMSCFVSTLPIETACRAWDCLWYEGSKTLFRVALAIFRIGEPEISRAKDMAEVFQVVQTLPRSLLDANLVMDIATRKNRWGVGTLSRKMVETSREERRALYRTQQGETIFDIAGVPGPPPVPDGGGGGGVGGLKRSLSRVTLKRLKSTSRKNFD